MQTVNRRWRVPKQCAELAELVCRWHIVLHNAFTLKTSTALNVLQKTDAFRRPERFQTALDVCQADIQGRLGRENAPYPQRTHWLALLEAAAQTDTAAIAAACEHPADIPEAIRRARLEAIRPLHKARAQTD